MKKTGKEDEGVPLAFISIVNYNGWQDTLKCVESLELLSHQNIVVFIVDNNSTDGSVEKIVEWYGLKSSQSSESDVLFDFRVLEDKDIKGEKSKVDMLFETSTSVSTQNKMSVFLIRSSVNLGFAGGNNIVLRAARRHAKCKYVWLLNNDAKVLSNTLTEMIECACRGGDEVGLLGSVIVEYDQPEIVQSAGSAYNFMIGTNKHLFSGLRLEDLEGLDDCVLEDSVDYAVGASLLITRKNLLDVGLFYEPYFLYFEEIDYSVRAKRMGYMTKICRSSIVMHKKGASINKDGYRSELSEKYAFRNRLLFTIRHYPWFVPSVYLGMIYCFFTRLIKLEFRRSRIVLNAMFLK